MNMTKILVVDDEPTNVKIVKEALSDFYEVESASDGHEAIQKVAAFDPDIVVLDVMLPGMSGYEVCREIKCMGGCEYLKVIFTSGKSLVEMII